MNEEATLFQFFNKIYFPKSFRYKKSKRAGGLALSYCSKNSGVGQNKNGPSNHNSDSLNVKLNTEFNLFN